MHKILPLREQAEIENRWLSERLDTVLPELMARANVDMWLVIAREYNEDPIIMTMLPAPSMTARRRTILVFERQEDGSVSRFQVSRYSHPGYFDTRWKPEETNFEEDQYACLARLIRERDPQTIAINKSVLSAFGDGLSQSEYELLFAALDETYRARLVDGEAMAIGWLERRIAPELTAYPRIVALGHAIIAKMFSAEIIHPGVTTTDDLVWWMRQTMRDHGVDAWFQPSLSIQAEDEIIEGFYDGREPRKLIQPGDLLHCDMGFTYLTLTTDQQQMAYVLKPGEFEAPAGLRAALAAGNRLQDIHMQQMAVGKTGNEVLAATLAQARDEGIEPMVYSHPLGFHGHAAGPTIGLWDRQDGVPGLGDYPIYDNTCYSIELNISAEVPEWGGAKVRIMLEEDAALVDGQIGYMDGRQTAFHLIG